MRFRWRNVKSATFTLPPFQFSNNEKLLITAITARVTFLSFLYCEFLSIRSTNDRGKSFLLSQIQSNGKLTQKCYRRIINYEENNFGGQQTSLIFALARGCMAAMRVKFTFKFFHLKSKSSHSFSILDKLIVRVSHRFSEAIQCLCIIAWFNDKLSCCPSLWREIIPSDKTFLSPELTAESATKDNKLQVFLAKSLSSVSKHLFLLIAIIHQRMLS